MESAALTERILTLRTQEAPPHIPAKALPTPSSVSVGEGPRRRHLDCEQILTCQGPQVTTVQQLSTAPQRTHVAQST